MKIYVEIKKDKIIYNNNEISMKEFLVMVDCIINNRITGNTKFNIELSNDNKYIKFDARR